MEHDRASRFGSRRKTWILACLATAWFVWLSGVFGNSGLIQAYQLSQVRRDMSLRVRALENERQRLQASLSALDHDSFVQETAVRETLGFVRPSELVFEFRQ